MCVHYSKELFTTTSLTTSPVTTSSCLSIAKNSKGESPIFNIQVRASCNLLSVVNRKKFLYIMSEPNM